MGQCVSISLEANDIELGCVYLYEDPSGIEGSIAQAKSSSKAAPRDRDGDRKGETSASRSSKEGTDRPLVAPVEGIDRRRRV